jgi:uncharacterized protein DUF4304
MTEMRKTLESSIAQVLKPLGYTKRGATWHRDRGQVISVVNLQKSQRGSSTTSWAVDHGA